MRSLAAARTPLILALLALAELVGCGEPGARTSPPQPSHTPPVGSTPAPPSAGCLGSAPAAVDAQAEQKVLELVNAERRQRGLVELRAAPVLADAARLHARDMANDNYVDHDSFDRSDGRLAKACEWSERVLRFVPDEHQLAENIAAGASTPQEVVEGWMRSPVHRRNMLGTAFTELGVGYWPGGNAGFYWVADFAGGQ
jgi:uncharacterized protein YkwD